MEDDNGADWFGAESATFGDRLAGAREAARLSQADLARRLGVKEKTVRAWEEDLSEPRANKLQMLAGVLNVSITWLLSAQGHGLARPAADPDPDGDAGHVLTEMRQLGAELDSAAARVKVLEKRLRSLTAGAPERESRTTRLRRLRMRSMRRGIREMDLVLSGFAERQLAALGEAELELYDAMLSENDHDLYQWVSGQTSAPQHYRALVQRIAAQAGSAVTDRA